jgi:hypothetical protein
MGRPKKIKEEVESTVEEVVEETIEETPAVVAPVEPNKEKEELLALLDKLNSMKITRIADLENKIANCK